VGRQTITANVTQINTVKEMKAQILKVAQDLEKGTIDSDKARSLLLGLFGVSGSLQPLTFNRVSEMMQQLSKETWIALQGDEHGWVEWWNGRNKMNVNSNDR
jgi:hypothetical protein